jgi:Flp pilus assembly protein TadG
MKLMSIKSSMRLSRFQEDQSGSATILSLFFVLIGLVVGGLAIDFNKAISDRTQLQAAADSAAHAALYSRETMSASDAKNAAVDLVQPMLPGKIYAGAITVSDINFGSWDFDTNTFTADPDSKEAVQVSSEMTLLRGNASQNLLLRIVGQDTFNIVTSSIYATYLPSCFTEGFVADEVVDLQSNNAFYDGFCVHSNDYVSLNSNNYFEQGTVVSMPSLNDLDLPTSGFESNDGLQSALRTGKHRLRILKLLPKIIAGLTRADQVYTPDYITSGSIERLTVNRFEPEHFVSGRVHLYSCAGTGKATMNPGLYENMVLVTDCELKFGQGVILKDVIVATTNTSSTSFNSPSGFQLGVDDNCGTGGGAILMTLGGVNFASALEVYGGQILAHGDIDFSAQPDGMEGASFVSYGHIESTSSINMGFCWNRGLEHIYTADYFRMVN